MPILPYQNGNSSSAGRRCFQCVECEFAQRLVLSDPNAIGQPEAVFCLLNDLLRQECRHRLFEDIAQLRSPDLEVGGMVPGKVRQNVIQQREPRRHTGQFAHLCDLGQVVIVNGDSEIEVEPAIQVVSGSGSGE